MVTVFGSTLAMADPSDEPPPQVVQERTFERPPVTVGEVLAAPFYLPEMLIGTVLYPLGRFTGWASSVSLPERVIDLISDDTKRIWVFPSVRYSTSKGISFGGTFLFNNMFYEHKDLAVSGKIYTNLDRSVSISYSKAPTFENPWLYSIKAKYHLDTNADFYGVGIDTSDHDKSIYSEKKGSFLIEAGQVLRRFQFVRIVGNVGVLYTDTDTSPGGYSKPGIQETFDPRILVGFGDQILWIRYGLAVSYDSRIPSGHPYRGWHYYFGVDRFEDPRGSYDHFLFSGGIATVINLYQEENTIAIGVRARSAEDWGGALPFYQLNALDKGSPLRGFPSGRFRDRRVIVGNIEYRFPMWKGYWPDPVFGLGTLFVDVGKPFDDIESFTRGGVLYSVGIGLLVTTKGRFFARAQLGYGGEGIEALSSLGGAF